MEQIQKNAFVEWDLDTITAGDYTVEFPISDNQYSYFVDKFLDEKNPISEIGQFRLYIKFEMETRLSQIACDDHRTKDDIIKVGVVTCAYDNPEIIVGLRERGTAIKNEQWAEVDKINNKMTDMLHGC